MASINHSLAITHHDIIMIQETWFDDKISDQEIVASTDFSIFRRDRSESLSRKVTGGVVITLIKTNIQAQRVNLKL